MLSHYGTQYNIYIISIFKQKTKTYKPLQNSLSATVRNYLNNTQKSNICINNLPIIK